MANIWDDYLKYSGWGTIGNTLFPSYTNPANAAMPYLNQVQSTISPYYQPYIDTGLNSMNQYYNNASAWATPQGAMNDYNTIAAGYTESPYAQFQTTNDEEAAAQAAAASGEAGTPEQQVAVANQINGITSKDQQEYINSVLGIQNQGQQGLGTLTGLGYNASNTEAQTLAKNLAQQAALQYMGTAMQNAHNQQNSNMWMNLAGSAASFF